MGSNNSKVQGYYKNNIRTHYLDVFYYKTIV